VAERRSVAADVVGSTPTSRPNAPRSPARAVRALLSESALPRSLSPQSSPVSENAAAGSALRIYAGTSGWAYATWKPEFYPKEIPSRRFLEHYASGLNSVEVNFTFRRLPTESMLAGWLSAAPSGFQFSFKAPQRITHFNRLRDCEGLVGDFVGSVQPAQQAGKLGLLLFQLPPNFKAAPHRLADFLGMPALRTASAPRLAFEFRDPSWFSEETYAILREHNAALCVAESDNLSTPEVQCARTHSCFRMRRAGGYSAQEIQRFAQAIVPLSRERDIYVYFKHEDAPTGALNAVDFLAECSRAASA
jgi:uncharacterized protein YecE (DUF72 family)